MSRHFLVRLMTLTAVVAMMTMVPPGLASEDTALPPETQTQVANTLQSAPIMFIENVGQFDDGARFRVYGGGHDLWLAEDALWITVLEPPPTPDAEHLLLLGEEAGPGGDESQPHQGVALRLSFVDANPHPTIESFSRLDTHVSYFIGNDPAQWHPDAPVWGGVRYKDLYPGIDLELTSESGHYTQRLVVRNGADVSAVRLRVEGAEAVKLDGDRLCLTTAVGEYTLPLFQVAGAALSDLPSPAITSNQIASPFAESAIPTPQSAIVNPQSNVLLYATFLGGSDRDYGEAIAMDSGGAAYVTGTTYSVDFPTTPGAFDATYSGGGYDAFVVKLNATGSALTYATFLGGSSYDKGLAIDMDGSGAVYITGWTLSSDFPTTPGAVDRTHNGAGDVFVVKINTTGSALVYSTFLGGSAGDRGCAIAVDESGAAYVTGETSWHVDDFPTTSGAFDRSHNGYDDAFVVKLNSTGSVLVYATFLGGSSDEWSSAIVVDGSGAAHVTGFTYSSNFPTTSGAFDRSHNGGDYDAFVAKLNATGSALTYATFLGGNDRDFGSALAIDPGGAVYVTGYTSSSDFPTTPGAFDTTHNGSSDAFVVKLNATGSELTYATFLGESGGESGSAIAVDTGGAVYVTGSTSSSDFPTTSGAFDTSYGGGTCGTAPHTYPCPDAFVAKVNASGTDLAYATFLGGSGGDNDSAIAVDTGGAVYVTGYTSSSDFPTTPGAFDTTFNGGDYDAFVAKLAVGGEPDNFTDLGNAEDEAQHNLVGWGAAQGPPDNPLVSPSGDRTKRYQALRGDNSLDLLVDTVNVSYLLTAEVEDGWCTDNFEIYINGEGPLYQYEGLNAGTGPTNAMVHRVLVLAEYITQPKVTVTFRNTSTDNCGLAAVYNVGLFPLDGFFYSVTGHIRDGSDNPIPSVIVSAGTGGFATTDAGGIYTITNLITGTYTLTPTKSGWTFTPATRTVNVPPDATGIDFTGMLNLSVSHIEVTQATQDENNSVLLIAGKPTFVRVYMDCGEGCTSLPNVTGVLRGYGPSGELSGSPLSSLEPFITAYHKDDWRNQRGDLQKTLNFWLPPEWRTGTITLAAEVNGAIANQVVPFQPAQTLRVAYVPIHYDPPWWECHWTDSKDPDSFRIALAYLWAWKVYPTARIEYIPWPGMNWDRPLRKKFCLGEMDLENSELLKLYLSLQLRLAGEGEDRPRHIFGWLPDGALGGGLAYTSYSSDDPATGRNLGGQVAFGDDDPKKGPITFAHEVAHLLKRPHTKVGAPGSCGNPTPGIWSDWPDFGYPDDKIQEWGIDIGSVMLKDPSTTHDYMSYCWFWHDMPAWTSPWTYEHIYSETLKPEATALTAQPLSTPQPYFIASGLVYTDNTAILEPIWIITTTVTPENPPEGTQYCLEAQDTSGTPLVSRCFDLTFVDYETGEATNVDGFNLMLPYPDGVARAVLKKESNELAIRMVSTHAPIVTVTSPNGGESWSAGGTYTITWSASDADGDSLTYSILFSPDGSSWVPVGTIITQTQLAINSAELAGGDEARITVLASDGINTSSDESDGIFIVGQKPPAVYILSPEEDIVVPPDSVLWLYGYAYDLEDGALEAGALEWSSSQDGSLGTGSETLVTLSSGQHVITLTAKDSDDNTATATMNVFVGHRIYLPLVLRNP